MTHALSIQPAKPFTLQPGEKLVVTIEQQSETRDSDVESFPGRYDERSAQVA